VSSILASPVVQSLLIIVAATLLALGAGQLPMVQQVEQWTEDLRMIQFQPRPAAPDPNIVVVAITDKVLDQFAYRSPVDRAFLAGVLKALQAKHVKAIGLDVLFDKATEPAKDALLRETIRQTTIPLLISFVDDPRIMDPASLAYVEDFVPKKNRGMANVPTDSDGIVRSIYPGEMRPGGYQMGLARAILDQLGKPTPDDTPPLVYKRNTVQGKSPFMEFPANLAANLPEAWLKDKIVLIGAHESLIDNHGTPFMIRDGQIDGQRPGIVVHAHGLAQLLEGYHLDKVNMPWLIAITAVMALLDALLSRLTIPLWARFGGSVVIAALYGVLAFAAFYAWLLVLPVVVPIIAVLLSAWISDTVIGRTARKQRNMIQGAMSRYVSPKLVKQLIDDPSMMNLGGERREMSFLFTDVAGFTTLSEGMTSEKLTQVLNDYLTGACKIIIEDFDGTVCSFIGDAIFALWNAPVQQPDHRERIVKCAMAVSAYAEAFYKAQQAQGVPFGHTRIGLHCGEATIGNFGAPDKLSYTAIGDAVNLSARLEGVNKYFGTRICVSDTIASKVEGVTFRSVANVIVKGKSLPIAIYEPVTEAQIESGFHARYMQAFALMDAKDPAAHDAFRQLAADFPEDGPTRYHLDRLDHGKTGSLVSMDDK
jgi:class 3 adenylate cyclase/CHASE2 domain-containing sensor protein